MCLLRFCEHEESSSGLDVGVRHTRLSVCSKSLEGRTELRTNHPEGRSGEVRLLKFGLMEFDFCGLKSTGRSAMDQPNLVLAVKIVSKTGG